MPSVSISARLPTATLRPLTAATTPWPGTLRKSVAVGWSSAASSVVTHVTTACATGCSDAASTAPTARITISSSTSSAHTASVTSGSPRVRVPVLSSTTTSIRADSSIEDALLNRTPRRAPRPDPTMMAVGVARPSASGQVITTTVIAYNNAVVSGSSENTAHAANVRAPPISATSTSQKAARSARRWPGALEFCASCTSSTICASAVSDPTFVARTRNRPFRLIVAPITADAGSLWTGRLSPVTIDSSTSLSPSRTSPSVGTLDPGRTTITSPMTTSEVGISASVPSRSTTATDGANSSSVRIASFAPPRARISNQWPSRTNAANIVDAS